MQSAIFPLTAVFHTQRHMVRRAVLTQTAICPEEAEDMPQKAGSPKVAAAVAPAKGASPKVSPKVVAQAVDQTRG